MESVTINSMKDVLYDFNALELNAKINALEPLPSIKAAGVVNENELNDAFIKVQHDISQIKRDVLSHLNAGKTVDPAKIKALFEKAENDIEVKRNGLFTQFHSKALTLPANVIFKESQFLSRYTNSKPVDGDEKPTLPPVTKLKKSAKSNTTSPGQKLVALQKLKSILNPTKPDARALLNKHYGIPLSSDGQTSAKEVEKPNRPITGKTFNQAPTVPTANRINGRTTPPPSTADDARKGILNLIERKLIPASSQLSISPSPVKQKKVVLHKPIDMREYKQNLAVTRPKYNLALVKFDESSLKNAVDQTCRHSAQMLEGDAFVSKSVQKTSREDMYQESCDETQPSLYQLTLSNQDLSRLGGPLPTPYNDNLQQRASHKFVIQNGITRTMMSDFVHFKQYYCLSWSSISLLLQKVEKLMFDYSVPIAFIDGDRLADLALFFEVGPKPTIKDLLLCVLNHEDVRMIIQIPGRRYMAPDGSDIAATKLQSVWRCYQKHSAYLEYRRRKWSAGIIALTWIMKCKMTMIRKSLRENKLLHLQTHRTRAKKFADQWSKLKNSKRVIIHIPSLGYDTTVREPLDKISLLQSKQIVRICDVKDPNVEVIYISPVNITEELNDYYMKLIEVISSTSEHDSNAMKGRVKLLTPTHYDRFPAHNLCLSSLLKYSTSMLNRLKTLIKGKQAYIVPGMMHMDDLSVAHYLDVPVLGTEPEVAHLYSMKSGVRRIFQAAGVSHPPGEHDIYTLQQIYRSLARLVTQNLNVKRWLFKIDKQFDGRGTAFCDIAPFLSCYQLALKEEERYGEEWKERWAHESIYNVILDEIPTILETYGNPVDKDVFPSWKDFLENFLSEGGIIEACPPSDSGTGITANLLIEPDGQLQILSVCDQVHSDSQYKCWGYTLPQTSIDCAIVNASARAIGEACKKRGVLGYFSVDFVTFINPKNDSQELWAVGLSLSYHDSYAMVQLMKALTNGRLDAEKNRFEVTVHKSRPTNVAYQSKRKRSVDEKSQVSEKKLRYCVFSSKLLHTNLNNVHYSVFFQICKAHGIGYDDKLKLGSTFTLIDQIQRESIGMLTLGETLEKAVTGFAINLSVIHNDISSPMMQGKSNFKDALNELTWIVETLKVNEKMNQYQYPTLDPLKQLRRTKSADKLSSGTLNTSRKTLSAGSSDKTDGKRVEERRKIMTAFSSIVNDDEPAVTGVSSSIGYPDNRYPSSPVSFNPGSDFQ